MNGKYDIVISEREKDGLYDIKFLPDQDGKIWHKDQTGLDAAGVLESLDFDLRETPDVYVLSFFETYEEARSNEAEISLDDAWAYFEQRE